MKSSYEIRARKFAQMIYPFITGCVTVDDYENAVENFNVMFHRNVRMAHGQTRIVLITSDYVLKIDYGKYGKRWGTCEDERKAYCKAVRDGYAHLFAKTVPYMVNERVFYIMPRINRIGAEYNGWDDAYDYVNGADYDYLYDNFRDLHYENFGWKNRRPVIVDYACLER
jgi:hypothetical protein